MSITEVYVVSQVKIGITMKKKKLTTTKVHKRTPQSDPMGYQEFGVEILPKSARTYIMEDRDKDGSLQAVLISSNLVIMQLSCEGGGSDLTRRKVEGWE